MSFYERVFSGKERIRTFGIFWPGARERGGCGREELTCRAPELNIPNHNKHQGKCGELQKISLKCRLRKDGSPHCRVDVPWGHGAVWRPVAPPVSPGDPGEGPAAGGQEFSLPTSLAPWGCSQQHKERLGKAPGGGFPHDHEVTTPSAGVQASQGRHLPRAGHPAPPAACPVLWAVSADSPSPGAAMPRQHCRCAKGQSQG